MTASAGFAAQLGIHTANPVTHRFEFLRCTLGARQQPIDANGIIGSRSRDIERVRGGLIRIAGEIDIEPTTAEIALLLPWIMGGAVTGGPAFVYALGEQLSERYVAVDRVAKVHTYDGVGVNRWTVSGRQGEPLRWALELIGKTETEGAAGTFPVLSIDLTTEPFVFNDGALTIATGPTLCKEWTLTVDNHIDPERFFQSTTLSGILALDRTTTFRGRIAYDSVMGAAIYGTGILGAAVALTSINGNQTFNIALPAVSFPQIAPDIPGRVEEMLEIQGTAYRKAGVSELTITSNATP